MFSESVTKEEFYKKYRGQPYRRIATPKDYPFIYLIHADKKNYNDNLDVDGDGSNNTVYFSSEGEGRQMGGNKAVLEHRFRKGVYNSLFLFDLREGLITFIGEYELDSVKRNENHSIDCFILKKVKISLDDVKVIYVDKVEDKILVSDLGRRENLFSERIINENYELDITNTNLEEGDFLDSNYEKINMEDILKKKRQEYIEKTKENKRRIAENLDIGDDNASEEETLEQKKVAQFLYILSALNRRIRKQSRKNVSSDPDFCVNDIFLYTVNVGCGLTNFLVICGETACEVWCFDWGSDRKINSPYVDNIKDCLNAINSRFFHGHGFKISKMFISHPDADHYNRVDYDMISDTEVWIDSHIYSAPSEYIVFLTNLLKKTSNFISPECRSSTINIEVKHPDKPIVLNNKLLSKTRFYKTSKSNNVSPLIRISFSGDSCLFSGDIMQQGWKWFKAKTGTIHLNADVYIHSHHGSRNGFITNIPKKNDTEYETITSKIDVLSTRNGAYSGIISAEMQMHRKFVYTKRTDNLKGLKYYMIDVRAKAVTPIY